MCRVLAEIELIFLILPGKAFWICDQQNVLGKSGLRHGTAGTTDPNGPDYPISYHAQQVKLGLSLLQHWLGNTAFWAVV